MSLESWKKEFYATPASADMTRTEAIEHSLKKWRGLRKSALKRHGLEAELGDICDPGQAAGPNFEYFSIDSESCALCRKYLNENHEEGSCRCQDCPLAIILGQSCDGADEGLSPYGEFFLNSDPKPMIEALEKTLRKFKDVEE